MSELRIAGGAFSVEVGGLSDSSPFVYAANGPSSSIPYPLLIVADVVDAVPGASAVAQGIVQSVATYLRHADLTNAEAALRRAFSTANERVIEENRSRTGMRRLHLGLTSIIVNDAGLHIAQCAPSQVLIWQDGMLHEYPKLSTWSARDITGTFASISYPLGFQAQITPRISFSHCEPDDVVSAVSWQFARRLHDTGALDEAPLIEGIHRAVFDEQSGERERYIHGAVFRLGTFDHGEGQVPADRRRNLPEYDESRFIFGGRNESRFDTLETGCFTDSVTEELPNIRSREYPAAGETDFVELRSQPERFTGPGHTEQLSSAAGLTTRNRSRHSGEVSGGAGQQPARKGYFVEILAGLLLSLSAAVVGVWQITKRDRPIHGPRDDGTLGLPHLQRWSDSYHTPRFEGVRRVSPRLQVNRFLLGGAIIALAGVASVLAFNEFRSSADINAADFDTRLAEITTIRTQVDPAVANDFNYDSLRSASVMLDELEAQASSDELLGRLQDERAAISEAMSTLTSMTYINNVQVLGAFPAHPEEVTPRLFTGAGRVFVLSDALYELDQASGVAIQLLSPGDVVGGSPIGTLLAADWNDDRLVAVDSLNAFMQNPADGEWHRVPLGVVTQGGFSDITAMQAFDRNLYYLSAELGRILKYDAIDLGASPEDWSLGSTADVVSRSVDFHIDGSIHVLLEDGQIATLFRGAIDRTVVPAVMPSEVAATALVPVAGGTYFYIVDGGNGRIIAVNSEGALFRQFTVMEGLPSLHGATDLVINESNGLAYVLVNNTLFAIRLTLPSEPSE